MLIYCTTGIRLSALPPMKLRHIQKLGDIYKFTVYENDEEYYTLCRLEECTAAIDAYLEFRERHFESLNPESPLIREEFDTVSLIRKKPKHVSGQKPIAKPQCLYCSNRTLTFRNVCVWNFGTVEPFRYNLLSLVYCFSYIYYK